MKIADADKEGVFLSTDLVQSCEQMTANELPLVGGVRINDMAGDWREFGRVTSPLPESARFIARAPAP
jgi:hypothetical protein